MGYFVYTSDSSRRGFAMVYPDQASRSAQLFERAQRVLPGGNTRHTVAFEPYPIYAVRGRGCKIIDADGVERIDFVNNYSSLIHGHGHPRVVEAVQRQADALMAVGQPTESEIALAELLTERVSSLQQLRFCNSGTEAVMFAIRAARAYTGKPKIAKVEGAYHGAYDHAETSLDPSPELWGAPRPVPVAHSFGTPAGVLSDVVVLPFNDIETSRQILDANKDDLAGVLVDAIVGRMAFLEATPEYLRFLRDWTRTNGRLLLMDEVLSFRAGYNGVQGKYGIEADITTLAKIIGGGLPVGAFGGKREIMSVFDHRKGAPKVPHAGTYNGNPLTMVAGRVSMELLTREEIDRINGLGDRLREGITAALKRAGVPGRGVGVGSMVAMMLDDAPFTDYRGFLPAAAKSVPRAHEIYRRLLDHGVLCVPQGGFFISTAMDQAIIDNTLAVLGDVLAGLAAPAASA